MLQTRLYNISIMKFLTTEEVDAILDAVASCYLTETREATIAKIRWIMTHPDCNEFLLKGYTIKDLQNVLATVCSIRPY